MSASSTGLGERTALVLVYLFGWISGLVLLLIEQRSAEVRLHAAQSVVIFGALTLLTLTLPTVPVLGSLAAGLLRLLAAVAWLVLVGMALFGRPPVIDALSPLVRRIEQWRLRRG